MGKAAFLSSMSPVGLKRTWISLKVDSVVSLSSGGLDSVVVEGEPPLLWEAGMGSICEEGECASDTCRGKLREEGDGGSRSNEKVRGQGVFAMRRLR